MAERIKISFGDLTDPDKLIDICWHFNAAYCDVFMSVSADTPSTSDRELVRSFDLLRESLVVVFPQFGERYKNYLENGPRSVTGEFVLVEDFLYDLRVLSDLLSK